jgi:hypothetical protein
MGLGYVYLLGDKATHGMAHKDNWSLLRLKAVRKKRFFVFNLRRLTSGDLFCMFTA